MHLKWFIGGTIFGLLFAYAHVYMGYKLDIPLYGILILAGKFISCTGQDCLPYLWGSMAISAILWGVIGMAVGLVATKIRGKMSSTAADDKEQGV